MSAMKLFAEGGLLDLNAAQQLADANGIVHIRIQPYGEDAKRDGHAIYIETPMKRVDADGKPIDGLAWLKKDVDGGNSDFGIVVSGSDADGKPYRPSVHAGFVHVGQKDELAWLRAQLAEARAAGGSY